MTGQDTAPQTLRIDRLLWFLRFTRTRAHAQRLVAEGHIRRNGVRVERVAQGVCAGDILVLPRPEGVRVVELLRLPARRGPAVEAHAHYRVLDETHGSPLAAPRHPAENQREDEETNAAEGNLQP